jgi:hypothetical protein
VKLHKKLLAILWIRDDAAVIRHRPTTGIVNRQKVRGWLFIPGAHASNFLPWDLPFTPESPFAETVRVKIPVDENLTQHDHGREDDRPESKGWQGLHSAEPENGNQTDKRDLTPSSYAEFCPETHAQTGYRQNPA